MSKIVRSIAHKKTMHDEAHKALAEQLQSFRVHTNLKELNQEDPSCLMEREFDPYFRELEEEYEKEYQTYIRFGWDGNFQKDFSWEEISNPFNARTDPDYNPYPGYDPTSPNYSPRPSTPRSHTNPEKDMEIKSLKKEGKWTHFLKNESPPVEMVSCSKHLYVLYTQGDSLFGDSKTNDLELSILDLIAMYAIDTFAMPCAVPRCCGYVSLALRPPFSTVMFKIGYGFVCENQFKHWCLNSAQKREKEEEEEKRNSKRRRLDHSPRRPPTPYYDDEEEEPLVLM